MIAPLIRIIYGKEDIKKDCCYCRKSTHQGFNHGAAYGYECTIQSGKRKLRRCKTCYFSPYKIRN